MTAPFFTVIVPTYNRGKLILKTLDSVFAQTFQDFEVIVVDDCSTDETPDVVRPLAEKGKIRYFRHEVNSERAKSRNTGMDQAKGQFVTFLDSDDLMYSNCLKDAFAFHTANPNKKLFFNRFEFLDENGKAFYQYKGKRPGNDLLKAIARGNFLACIGVFIDREIHQNHRFDELRLLSGSEDWEFWLRVFAHFPDVGRINKVNSAMVEHSGRSMNNLELEKLIERRYYILNKIKKDPHLAKTYAPYLKMMHASANLFIASSANTCGEPRKAIKYAQLAVRKWPAFLADPRYVIIMKNAVQGRFRRR